MANNTLPEDITKTINDIITEVNEFKKNTSTPECTLTGSVALSFINRLEKMHMHFYTG
jgi:hypothetical protein